MTVPRIDLHGCAVHTRKSGDSTIPNHTLMRYIAASVPGKCRGGHNAATFVLVLCRHTDKVRVEQVVLPRYF